MSEPLRGAGRGDEDGAMAPPSMYPELAIWAHRVRTGWYRRKWAAEEQEETLRAERRKRAS